MSINSDDFESNVIESSIVKSSVIKSNVIESSTVKSSFTEIKNPVTLDQKLAIKKDSDKPKYSLLSPYGLEELAKVATFGATKYAPHNWRKGFDYSRLLDASMRHILEYQKGNKMDDESKLPHLAHAMWNLMALLEQDYLKTGTNDLYKFN